MLFYSLQPMATFLILLPLCLRVIMTDVVHEMCHTRWPYTTHIHTHSTVYQYLFIVEKAQLDFLSICSTRLMFCVYTK